MTKGLEVKKTKMEIYKIGDKYFVISPKNGFLRDIDTGDVVSLEERNAYLQYIRGNK